VEEQLGWISDPTISTEEKQARFLEEIEKVSKKVALEQTKKVFEHLLLLEILNYSIRDNIYFVRKKDYLVFLTPEKLIG
jgi:uncharacterized protein YjcR